MTQLSIDFNPTSLARRSDPQSSKAAARKMVESGALRGQARQTYEALKRHPCKSSKVLSEITGLDRYMLARRCPGLWQAGMALRVELRSKDILWYAILG